MSIDLERHLNLKRLWNLGIRPQFFRGELYVVVQVYRIPHPPYRDLQEHVANLAKRYPTVKRLFACCGAWALNGMKIHFVKRMPTIHEELEREDLRAKYEY